MNEEIKRLDQALNIILRKDTFQNLTNELVENYTRDELHIMKRLLNQRLAGVKNIPVVKNRPVISHLSAIVNLAESIRRFK